MKRFIAVLSLAVSLVAFGGNAFAQDPGGSVINADGSSGSSTAGINPAVDADGPTVVYGDLDVGPGTNVIGVPTSTNIVSPPGTVGNITATDGNASSLGPGNASAVPGTVTGGAPGTALLGPDGTYSVSDTPPSNVSLGDSGTLAPAPEPVYEEPVYEEPIVEDAAIASDDLDGDNYPDAQELEVGLDPNNVDTDADGVADGDEVNIYGTDAFTWDTDGDGVSDGDELYGSRTDPLVWDDGGSEVASTGAEELAATDTGVVEATSDVAGVDSDGDRLMDADEAAIGTDPNTPDSDGDGYYDGDEAALGSDPFDPAAIPTA